MQILDLYFPILDFIAILTTLKYMHIIVDIRTDSPQDILPVRTGIAWARLWIKHKKEDTISFLIYDHQDMVADFHTIVVGKPFLIFWKKRITAQKTNQIFRCVNFSRFSPYDPRIPTISHIWTNAHKLYGDPLESSILRRYNDFLHRYTLKHSTWLIVPDIQIGRELVELYNIQEDRIEIIPYFPVTPFSDIAAINNTITQLPFFIYDGGYGNEANLLSLLSAWEKYKSEWWTHELLLIGAAMDGLSALTQMIRSLDLHNSVRYLWVLDAPTLHTLYQKARGWIYTGPYYSAGIMIEYAQVYKLPLLLSDIHAFDAYSGIKVHPNHSLDITQWLHQLSESQYQESQKHAESMYIHAYEKVLVKKY